MKKCCTFHWITGERRPCICLYRWLQRDGPLCRRKADTLREGWREWLHSPTRPPVYHTAPSSPPPGPWSEGSPLGLRRQRQTWQRAGVEGSTHDHSIILSFCNFFIPKNGFWLRGSVCECCFLFWKQKVTMFPRYLFRNIFSPPAINSWFYIHLDCCCS